MQQKRCHMKAQKKLEWSELKIKQSQNSNADTLERLSFDAAELVVVVTTTADDDDDGQAVSPALTACLVDSSAVSAFTFRHF